MQLFVACCKLQLASFRSCDGSLTMMRMFCCSVSSVCRRRRRCRLIRAVIALSVDSVSSRRSRRQSLNVSYPCAASSVAQRSSSWNRLGSRRRRRLLPPRQPGLVVSPRRERLATEVAEPAGVLLRRCRRGIRLAALPSWCSRCPSTRRWITTAAAAAERPGRPVRAIIIIFLCIIKPSSGVPWPPGLRPPLRRRPLRRRWRRLAETDR